MFGHACVASNFNVQLVPKTRQFRSSQAILDLYWKLNGSELGFAWGRAVYYYGENFRKILNSGIWAVRSEGETVKSFGLQCNWNFQGERTPWSLCRLDNFFWTVSVAVP